MGAYDISRVVFDPRKHYSSVRMQQGRVMVDDDWNESERIENEERRRSRVDIIGAHGSPDQGFRIGNPRIENGLINFDIHHGTYHLGGLRLEMDRPNPKVANSLENFLNQRDWLDMAQGIFSAPALGTGEEQYDLVYLDSWRQAVSAIEDDELFEKALAGPDTSTRIRNMRRVRLFRDVDKNNCAAAWKALVNSWNANNKGDVNQDHELTTNARLTVSYLPPAANANDLCSPAISGGYLGAENQAIRVQLINDTHLTWGFDNASSLYRVQATAADTISFLTFPRDQHHWPLAGQVVEILPWSAVLPNGEKIATINGHFSKVASSFDPDDGILTLDTPLPAGFGQEWQNRDDQTELAGTDPEDQYFFLRVWNRGTDLTSAPEIPFVANTLVTLGSTGLAVTLSGDEFRSRLHWIIAARPETPDQVTPWALEEGIAPHGIRQFVAPLALIRWTSVNGVVTGEAIRDCRKTFRPLTDLESCCTFSVGDGISSKGDFNSIEEAIDHLPASGGKICVLPGVHNANVELFGRKKVRISGCGNRSIVRPHLKRVDEPVFRISRSQHIQIDNLSILAMKNTAIELRDDVIFNNIDKKTLPSQEIMINDNHILACINGIYIEVNADLGGDNQITIIRNKIGMFDKEEGDVAIFCLADGVLIERNDIFVENPPNPDDPSDPRDPNGPDGNPYDPCADPKIYYDENFQIFVFLIAFFLFARRLFLISNFVYQYKTKGGIQIGGSSERVRILENRIVGGYGNGISLGHLPTVTENDDVVLDSIREEYKSMKRDGYYDSFKDPNNAIFVDEKILTTLYEISIENNQIQRMGLSGIGVEVFFNLRDSKLVISVEDLTIYRNNIRNCARQIPKDIPDSMQKEVAYGGVALADVEVASIQENRIEDNGLNHAIPTCGLFILNGEDIDITNNHILNNGPYNEDVVNQVQQGNRGGIVIGNSFKQFGQIIKGAITQTVVFDNVFTIKVHNNVVIQPMGHALFLITYGPVSVVGNQLCSQGVNIRNPFNLLAGSVFILNLGFSKDLITYDIFPTFSKVGTIKKEASFEDFIKLLSNPAFRAIFTAFQYLPTGQVLFTNNQVTLDLRNEETTIVISSQLILSLDDIAYNSNQSEVSGFLGITTTADPTLTLDIVITDVLLAGYSIRSNDNRLQEGFSLTLYSLISAGFMTTAVDNQSTHCLLVYGSFAAVQENNIIRNQSNCLDSYQSTGKFLGYQTSPDYSYSTRKR